MLDVYVYVFMKGELIIKVFELVIKPLIAFYVVITLVCLYTCCDILQYNMLKLNIHRVNYLVFDIYCRCNVYRYVFNGYLFLASVLAI